MYVTSALHENFIEACHRWPFYARSTLIRATHLRLIILKIRNNTSRQKKKKKIKKKKNIYIYMRSVFWFFSLFNARYVEVERDIYWDREKIKRLYLYFHPYKPVSWLLTHQGILCLSMRAPISPSQSLTPH